MLINDGDANDSLLGNDADLKKIVPSVVGSTLSFEDKKSQLLLLTSFINLKKKSNSNE